MARYYPLGIDRNVPVYVPGVSDDGRCLRCGGRVGGTETRSERFRSWHFRCGICNTEYQGQRGQPSTLAPSPVHDDETLEDTLRRGR